MTKLCFKKGSTFGHGIFLVVLSHHISGIMARGVNKNHVTMSSTFFDPPRSKVGKESKHILQVVS